MNVVFTTGCWPITQVPGCLLHRKHGISLGFSFGVCGPQRGQSLCRMAGAMPGSKILGSEILLRDLPQVFVYVRRIDLYVLTRIKLILEQLLPREILAFLDDFGDP